MVPFLLLRMERELIPWIGAPVVPSFEMHFKYAGARPSAIGILDAVLLPECASGV